MGIINSNKELNVTKINCGDSFKAKFIAHYIDDDFDCCSCDEKIE